MTKITGLERPDKEHSATRKARYLTQTAVAAQVKKSRARLNALEHQKQDVQLTTVARIAKVLQIHVTDLLS